MTQKSPLEELSVVVPMYNEAGNVLPLITEIYAALQFHPQVEIIVVDDGSTDATLSELNHTLQLFPTLKICKHQRNLGQSTSVVTGVYAAQYAWIVTLDGDGQNNPVDVLKVVQAAHNSLSEDSTILFAGNRVDRKDTGWKRFGSRFANSIRQRLLHDNCPDSGCGLKLFPRDIFLQLPHFDHLHRFLPALFKRAGAKIVNVPISHRPRMRGVSKYGNWARLKVGIADLLGVAWLIRRPCMIKEVSIHQPVECGTNKQIASEVGRKSEQTSDVNN